MLSLIALLSISVPALAEQIHFKIATAGDHVASSFGDASWPSKAEWDAFNETLTGNLVEAHSPARFCHTEFYDEALCEEAKANWDVSEWKSNFPGGFPGGADYGYGDDLCTPNTPKEAPCNLGKIPPLVAEVESEEDVIKSLAFVRKHNLNVRIRSTGHSLYGASAGKGAFAISVHKLKSIKFVDDFQLAGTIRKVGPAVVVGAGVQFLELYKAADEAGRTVLGGGCDSVGISGYILGGGHGRYSPVLGLGVDQVLQFTIVTPTGLYLTVNEVTNPDLWWAVRGGGGGWGVLTEIVVKTYPAIENEVVNNFVLFAKDEETWTGLIKNLLSIQPALRDNGWSGLVLGIKAQYMMVGAGFKPNVSSIEDEEKLWTPVTTYGALNNLTVLTNFTAYKSFYELTVAEPFANQHSFPLSSLSPLSRLVPRHIYENSTSLDVISEYWGKNMQYWSFLDIAGGAVSKKPHDSALHPSWREAIGHFLFFAQWQDGDSYETQYAVKAKAHETLKEFSDLLGLEAAYLNEASPDDYAWPKSWWGENYDRLLKIKNEYDPEHLLRGIGYVGSK